MQSPSNDENQTSSEKKAFLNLPYEKILLQGGLYLGVIVAFLLLVKGSDVCIATIDSCTAPPFPTTVLAIGGGAAALFGLTSFLGIPLLPAVGIALAVWWLLQASLS